jgi:membrane dipeptidase
VNCKSPNTANISDIIAHINYVKNFLGVDYVGLGGNYDGVPV